MNFKARISVFGGRQITDEIYEDTRELGRILGKDGYLVYCGGGSGVMEAVSKGVDESIKVNPLLSKKSLIALIVW